MWFNKSLIAQFFSLISQRNSLLMWFNNSLVAHPGRFLHIYNTLMLCTLWGVQARALICAKFLPSFGYKVYGHIVQYHASHPFRGVLHSTILYAVLHGILCVLCSLPGSTTPSAAPPFLLCAPCAQRGRPTRKSTTLSGSSAFLVGSAARPRGVDLVRVRSAPTNYHCPAFSHCTTAL